MAENGPEDARHLGEIDGPNASAIGEKVPAPFVLDNEPACGAPKGWRWGYLPCGCRNDGYGNHLNDSRSRLAKADAHAAHFGGPGPQESAG